MQKCLQKGICWLLCLLPLAMVHAQPKPTSGTVVSSEDGTPLQGVTVTNSKTKERKSTNDVGYFSIVAEKGQELRFTYVGFNAVEVIVGDDATLNVKMIESTKDESNVVITAYDIRQSKRDLTYQAITVSGEEIAQTKRENFINSLAGRIPGATVTATTGMPGASSSIILRGPTSIDGSNQPIFVVDGLIIDNSSFEMQDRLPAASAANGLALSNRNNDYGNRAMDINPEDIASITVLKGPEATALYGSDGANGAIIITTKKGTKGKASLSYDNSFRWSKVTRFPQIQTKFDQGTNGVRNDLLRSYFGEPFREGVPIYNNIEDFFQSGLMQIHNLSVDGGTEMATYRFTGSVNTQDGVVPNTGYNRYNFRLTSGFKLSPKINVNSSFTYISSRTDKASKGSGGFLLSLLSWPSDDNAKNYQNPDGSRRTIRGDLLASEDDNPYFDINKNKSWDITDRLMGNVQFNFDPAKWVNITAIAGVDYFATVGTWFFHPQSNVGRVTSGLIWENRESQRLLNGVVRATFRKKIRNFNNILTVAGTADSRKYEVNAIKGERFFEPEFMSINNADPLTISSRTTAENYNRGSAFATYSGNFKNYLSLSLSGRTDGSSRLVDPLDYEGSSPWYFYWSAGAAFIFSEAFKNKMPDWMDLGKLRINYATTGRDPRVPYVMSNRFTTSPLTGGGLVNFVTQGNPDLRPENSTQFEAGGEFKFFKNRLGLDIAYYENTTKNQLMNPRLSYATGAILKWINGGTVQNRGWEFQLTGSPVRTKNLNWDVTVNWSRNRNEILAMPEDLPFFYNSDTWITNGVRGIAVKGGSIYEFGARSYATNTAGQVLISPTTGLPIKDARYNPFGDRNPNWNMGLLNSITYKQITLSFLLDLRYGGDIYNATEQWLYQRGLSVKTLDRETPRIITGVYNDGLQNTANPTPNSVLINPFFRSDYYSSDAAIDERDFIERDVNWLRLRDVTLSYRFPASLMKRQKAFKSAQLFFTGTDLFILSNYSGVDPSTNANNTSTRGGVGGIGMDFGNLATPVGLNFGLKVQF